MSWIPVAYFYFFNKATLIKKHASDYFATKKTKKTGQETLKF